LDHTIPYLPMSRGGPPGQTGVDTLGPLSRSAHRATTFGRWRRRQPDPGTFTWRSPNGWIYLVSNQGTFNLGNSPFAHAVWHAAIAAQHPDSAQKAS
ncbi:MAG: HNH endonuclease, partial [Propionibacteriaceae bacterium]